jgi:hypothetical protein
MIDRLRRAPYQRNGAGARRGRAAVTLTN